MFTFSTSTSLNALISKCKSPSFISCSCSTFQQLCAVANISGNQHFVMSQRCPNSVWTPSVRCKWSCDVLRLTFFHVIFIESCSAQARPERKRSDSSYNTEPFWKEKKKKENTGWEKRSLAGMQNCLSVCVPPSIMLQRRPWLIITHILKTTTSVKRKAPFLFGSENVPASFMHAPPGKKEKQVRLPPPCKKFLSRSKNKQKKTQKAKLIALLKRTLSRRDVNKNIDCGLSFRSRIGGAMESSDKSSIQRLYLLVQLLHLSPPCPISRHAPNTAGLLRSIMSHICAVQPCRPRLWRPAALIQRLASVPGGHSPGLAAPGGPVSPALSPQLSDSLVRIRTAAEAGNCVTFPVPPGHQRERWPPIHFCEVARLVRTAKMLLASGLLLHRTAPAVGSLPIRPLKFTWCIRTHPTIRISQDTAHCDIVFCIVVHGKSFWGHGGFYTPTSTNPTTKDYQLENKLLFHTVMLRNIFGVSLSLSLFLHFPDKPFW